MWCLRGPFHDTEGKAYRNKTRELKESTNCILPHHPRNGRKASLPKSWSFADLNVHGIDYEMDSQPGGDHWLCVPPKPALCCSWLGRLGMRHGGGLCPEGGIWNLPQVGPGTRSKDPFRQNCDKVSWFSQLLEERWVLEFTAWVSELFRLQVRQTLHIFPLYLSQL